LSTGPSRPLIVWVSQIFVCVSIYCIQIIK
jgi:hypothetical protein